MPLARKLALFVYKLTHRRTGELLSPYLLDRLEGVRCFLEIILFCLLGLYIFWQWLSPTVVVRYRLTLYVAVGDQIRSGSGVLQVTAHDVRFLMPIVGEGGPWSVSQKGEAVAVDLGPRGLLVATLFWDSTRQSSRALDGLETLAASRLPDGGFFSDWLWEINLPTVAIDVPLDDLPMLVRFRDRADRQSAERVAPNDLARAFGADVRLVHATIEIVPHGYWPFNLLSLGTPRWLFGVPVTEGLERSLPWLRSWDGRRSHLLVRPKNVMELPPEYTLDKDAFVRGGLLNE